jgi:uncharacterized protein YegL
MNGESPIDPRSALEASLTALLLGELPHDQAAALHQKLAQDANLAALYERLKHTIALVRETVASPAQQTTEHLIPLRISEQRRQKLLEQFKTVTPKQFARPRRSATRWLVPVALAACCVVILGGLLLPALSKAKSRGQYWSIGAEGGKVEEKSAEMAASVPQAAMLEEGRRNEASTERYAASPGGPATSAAPPPPLQPAPQPSFSGGAAIVLPQSGQVVDASTTPADTQRGDAWFEKRAASKDFYDHSSAGVGGVVSSSDFGNYTAGARGGAAPPESRPTEIASANTFFSQLGPSSVSEASKPIDRLGVPSPTPAPISRGSSFFRLAGEPPATPPPAAAAPTAISGSLTDDGLGQKPLPPTAMPAAPGNAVAEGIEVARVPLQMHDGAVMAGDLVLGGRAGISGLPPAQVENKGKLSDKDDLAWDARAKKAPDALYLGGAFQAGTEVKAPTELQKGLPMAGFAAAPEPSTAAGSLGYGITPSQTLTAGEESGRAVETSNFGSADVANGTAKYGWQANSFARPSPSTSAEKNVPMLGDVPALGRLYRSPAKDVTPGARAKIEERVKSTDLADGEDHNRNGSKAAGKTDGRPADSSNLHSLNVVGYYNMTATREALPVPAPARAKPSRRPQSPIALPPTDAGVTLAFNDISGQDEKTREEAVAASEPTFAVGEGFLVKGVGDTSKRWVRSFTVGDGVSPASDSDTPAARKPAPPAPVPQPEVPTSDNAFSTFSLNVSDVSFKLAGASLEKGVMPEPATVRSEEFINAFDYRDPEPPPGVPVAFAWERAQYPFAQGRDLLRFSIKTAALGRTPGRPLNIVLLLDNSGSMERADRVQIIREALRVLAGQLQPQDKFSVVTFARTARLWVDGVPGSQAAKAAEEVGGLTPQGGTNLEEAMNLAYQTALRHYLPNGVNRVVLLTDGAANLGNVDPEALKQKVEAQRKQGIALDCFGIGWEGYNDDVLEALSRNGDGRYGFINTPEEAATEFAGQLAGALHVAASDVKVQVEFNPARVTAYRQIGYAKHQLTKEQFRDNTVDAAEIAAAESGNALYVIAVNSAGEGPLATVRVRYKVPGTSDYHEHEWPVPYTGNAMSLEQGTPAMRLAATASAFSEWLVSSPYAGEVTPDRLLKYLSGVPDVYGADPRPKKLEWMIRQAKSIR